VDQDLHAADGLDDRGHARLGRDVGRDEELGCLSVAGRRVDDRPAGAQLGGDRRAGALGAALTGAARQGLLKVPVADAVARILAANVGVTLSLIGQPPEARDPELSAAVREGIFAAVFAGESAGEAGRAGNAGRARPGGRARPSLCGRPSVPTRAA
jgi:hypothetical protein